MSGALTEEDEDAVEAELASIIQQQLPSVPEEELAGEQEMPELPDVPAEPGNKPCHSAICRKQEGKLLIKAKGSGLHFIRKLLEMVIYS